MIAPTPATNIQNFGSYTGADANGIWLNANRCVISNNYIEGGSSGADWGIRYYGGAACSIMGNVIYGCDQYSIDINSGPANFVVVGNTCGSSKTINDGSGAVTKEVAHNVQY